MAETPQAQSTDEMVEMLMDLVREKKARIKSLERPSYITKMAFSFSEELSSNDIINLQAQATVELLLKISGYLGIQRAAFRQAAEDLGVTPCPEFKWQGYPGDSWLADLKTRLDVIQIGAERNKLAELEKRVEAITSPEQRRLMEIAALRKELA